jgi:large subunit ribosomal protein L16
MKLQPKKSKYAKSYKGKAINRIISKNHYNQFTNGSIALKTLVNYRLSGKQIENLYITLNKFLKKSGTINITVFPNTPVSKKPNEIRMGKGKGAVNHWVCRILPGTIICEIETNNLKKALKAITYAKFRLPIKIKTLIL